MQIRLERRSISTRRGRLGGFGGRIKLGLTGYVNKASREREREVDRQRGREREHHRHVIGQRASV